MLSSRFTWQEHAMHELFQQSQKAQASKNERLHVWKSQHSFKKQKAKKKKPTKILLYIIGYQSLADMDASRMIWESSKSRLVLEGSSRKDATN